MKVFLMITFGITNNDKVGIMAAVGFQRPGWTYDKYVHYALLIAIYTMFLLNYTRCIYFMIICVTWMEWGAGLRRKVDRHECYLSKVHVSQKPILLLQYDIVTIFQPIGGQVSIGWKVCDIVLLQ